MQEMNVVMDEVHRLFTPHIDPGRYRIPRSDLIVYNPEKRISQLMFQAYGPVEPKRDEFSMVVHIDGACRDNGKSNARASYGIYFGPDSPYNFAGLVPDAMPRTSTRAEIEALGNAIPIIESICTNDMKLQQIKIATDSQFLVNAMSKWIVGWFASGGIGAGGREVEHFDRLQGLHEKLDEMEYGDDGGIEVHFWHINRELNKEADALANRALDT